MRVSYYVRKTFKKPIWVSSICKWLIWCDSFPLNDVSKELINYAAQGFLQCFPWQAFRCACLPSAVVHVHHQQDLLSCIHTGTTLLPRKNTLHLSFSQSAHVEGEGRWLKSRKSRGPTAPEVSLTQDFAERCSHNSPSATSVLFWSCVSPLCQGGSRVGLQTA